VRYRGLPPSAWDVRQDMLGRWFLYDQDGNRDLAAEAARDRELFASGTAHGDALQSASPSARLDRRRYRLRNPDRIKEQARLYYQRNKPRIEARKRALRFQNRERDRMAQRNRRELARQRLTQEQITALASAAQRNRK
jgi:hypothetical protein